MVDCCFNCAAPCYAPYLGRITTFYIKSSISEGEGGDKPDGPVVQVNVNVVDALSVIFEGALKYSGAQIPTNEGGSPDQCIGVCINCAAILIDLYTYYVKFMNLSTASSALAKCIQCRLWKFNCNNGNDNNDNGDGVVIVKADPDIDDDSRPVQHVYDVDNDNDDDSDIEFLEEVIVKVKDEEPGTFPPGTIVDDDEVVFKFDPLKPSSLVEVDGPPPSSQKKPISKSSNRLCPRYRKKLAKKRLAYALKRAAASEATGKLKCPHCPKYYSIQSNLNSHITRAHSSKLKIAYCCTICGKLVRSRSGLTLHKKRAHGIPVMKRLKKKMNKTYITCNICSKQMAQSYLRKHLKYVHGESGYVGPSCAYCGNKYKSSVSLGFHLQAKHSVEILAAKAKSPTPSQSQISSSSTSTTTTTTLHGKKYRSTRYCKTCKISFLNQLAFLQHKLQIHPEKATKTKHFKCTESDCVRIFSDRLQFLIHESVVHGKAEEESQELLAGRSCTVCNKKFAYPSLLKAHQETSWKCGGDFVKDVYDDDEQQHHQRNQPTTYTCGVCNQVFESLRLLLDHRINLHQAEIISSSSSRTTTTKLSNGSYICHECGKTFKDTPRLKQHLRSNAHGGSTRKYQCPTCSRLYSVEANYFAHLKLHSTSSLKSSLTCPECGNISSTKANLKKHLFSVHGLGVYGQQNASTNPTPYICHHCGRSFTLKQSLDQHLRTKQHGGPGLGVRTPRSKKPTKRIMLELKE